MNPAPKPFHHGRLREELLWHARLTLRTSGPGQVSLRQLAKDCGVSHGAPRRHFAGRQDLLDALAEQGFVELTTTIVNRADKCDGCPGCIFRAVASSYIDFAVADAALMDLMFASKTGGSNQQVSDAADAFFETAGALVVDAITPASHGIEGMQLRILLTSTLHGIAALVSSGRIAADSVEELIDDAASLFGAE